MTSPKTQIRGKNSCQLLGPGEGCRQSVVRGLLYKIHTTGIPIYLTKQIKSFLENRIFQIKIGIKQPIINKRNRSGYSPGFIFVPLTVVLYTNDIPLHQTNLALFADDTLYYVSNKNHKYAVARLQSSETDRLVSRMDDSGG